MNMMMRNTIAAAAMTLAGFAACTGGIGSELDTGSSGDSSGSSGEGGNGFNPNTSSGNANGGSENSCGNLSFSPELIGVDMIISVDRSGSMGNDDKWDNAEAAFTTFFTSEEADNLGVALRFWPEGDCTDSNCTVDGCKTPAVQLGPLSDDNHELALISAFQARNPTGLTPMHAALGGATQWALEQQQNAEIGKRVVVVFLTDGAPNGCNENENDIASIAASANAAEEVLTFSIGLEGSNEGLMNKIAVAGGTGPTAFFIGNQNGEQQLLAALQEIQEVAVACTFALPESPDPDKELDPSKVAINYDPGDGGEIVDIPQVGGASECGAEGGWYYDDPLNPAVIFLCDVTCDLINDVDKPDGKLGLDAACRLIAE